MLANRAGIFLATVGDHSVAPSEPNKLTTFIAQYKIFEELTNEGATEVGAENMEITGYHYLEKKDGSLNTFTIDKLKEAFGWDGRDPFWLEDSLPGDAVVKLTLGFETNPKTNRESLKVKFIDHRDAVGGGIVKATDQEKTQIRNRLGAKLRALAGGTPSKSPVPQGAPTMPAKQEAPPAAQAAPAQPQTAPAQPPAPPAKRGRPKSAPAAAVAPVTPPEATKDEAWAAFTKEIPATASEENVASEWTRILNAMFPDKGDEDMTLQDWAKVRDEAPGQFVPF